MARNLSDPRTGLDRFFRALGRAAGEVAPVAEEQASLFVNLDTSFTALASIARPYPAGDDHRGADLRGGRHPRLPAPAPVHPQQHRACSGSCDLEWRCCRARRRCWPTPSRPAPRSCPRRFRPTRTWPTCSRRSPTSRTTRSCVRASTSSRGSRASLKPTLNFLTPAQTVCNYATLWFRNAASLLSEGDSNGNWQRFQIISAPTDEDLTLGPNNEGGPSSAPANGPTRINHLHNNPYPNSAAPGQTRECEAGNERYLQTIGQTILTNQPGNQGTKTSGQKGINAAAAGVTP